MVSLGEYIAGRSEAPSRRELNRMLDRWEWFTTARRARALVTGEVDHALTLPLMFRATTPAKPTATEMPPQNATEENVSAPADSSKVTPAEMIDRFIEHGGYRIAPNGEATEALIDVDIDPEMVTEELAEIYRSQGLVAEAEKIYRMLDRTRLGVGSDNFK